MRFLMAALFLPLIATAAGAGAFDKDVADRKLLAFGKAFNEQALAANEPRPELAWFVAGGDKGRDFVKDAYNDSKDLKIRMPALYLFCKGWPTRCEGRLDDAETSEEPALREFGRRLRSYLRGLPYRKKLPPLATFLTKAPKDPGVLIEVLLDALQSGKADRIEKALRVAEKHAKLLFANEHWPLAAAGVFAKAKPPLAGKLTSHLLKHAKAVPPKVRAEMAKILKYDLFDVHGNQVAALARDKKKGLEAMQAALQTAEQKKDTARLLALLDAIRRRGGPDLLPIVAPFLDSDDPKVAEAALGVFKAHAKRLGPDTASPQACFVWWTVEGKKQFK